MLFKDNPWFSELQQQLMSNAALEGYFHIFILGHPLKHDYDSWQMLSGECIWMNIEHMHTTKTDYGTMLHLKDNLILSSYKTWLSTDVTTQLHWMNVRKAPTPKTDCVGQFVLKPDEHFTAWVWVIKAASLMRPRHFFSQIWSKELKGIYWEEHWAYNHEPLYCELWDTCLDN